MKYLSNPSVVKGLFTALLLLAASVARPQSANPDTPSYTMRSGGIERSYKLHLPQGLPQGAPLVVVLHGYGGNNDPGRFGLNAAADRHGFAVCYPQGAKDGRGKTCWNAGYPFQADMAVDDVKFIAQLVRHLQKRHGLSRRNVFCTGMSNGGGVCYQLASPRPRPCVREGDARRIETRHGGHVIRNAHHHADRRPSQRTFNECHRRPYRRHGPAY